MLGILKQPIKQSRTVFLLKDKQNLGQIKSQIIFADANIKVIAGHI